MSYLNGIGFRPYWCYAARRQYEGVARAIQQFEAGIPPQMYAMAEQTPAARNPNAPTGALLIKMVSA
jgi:hypothetical protein